MANVQKNYDAAMEHFPESFARVIMLYLPMEIQGVKVHAFVDSGAQNTILSEKIAKKTGLLRLVDQRYASVARGVGQARILGKVHMAQVKFGKLFYPHRLQ
eukprot:UN24157